MTFLAAFLIPLLVFGNEPTLREPWAIGLIFGIATVMGIVVGHSSFRAEQVMVANYSVLAIHEDPAYSG
jgi:hypothetical protein